MGYLINPNPLGNYQKFIVPEADIITGTYFLINPIPANSFYFLTFATFRLINSTINYQGYSHISLRQTGGSAQGVSETSIYPTPGEIEPNVFYNFAYMQQHSPNKLGSFNTANAVTKYEIYFDGTYIDGNGDIELHFYYNEINL